MDCSSVCFSNDSFIQRHSPEPPVAHTVAYTNIPEKTFGKVSFLNSDGSVFASGVIVPEGQITRYFGRITSKPVLKIKSASDGIVYTQEEWIGKYGELIRLDPTGQILDKRRMSSGRGTLQPIVFIDDAKHASAYFRQARRTGPKQIPVSHTASAGERWESAPDLGLANPNAAITGVELSDRTRLMVFNDLEHGRHRLVLAAAWPNPAKADSSQSAKSNYSPWKTIAVLEDETASTTNPKEEFSYPYMSLNQQGQVLLVYTWNRKRMKSILWDAGYLQSYLQHIKSETDRSQ
ncbi:MAG: hypothetical protein EBV46_04015 [Burkholderiaceae bacterium]|nr:hypothetical protein [Burkholderiaceae bacterium]